MNITFLGHAGFCVELPHSIIIMDPWLSDSGAFDAAWFQFPNNQHLQASLQSLISTSQKKIYIYISHEHQDHFDLPFLQSLTSRNFTILLADFEHPVIRKTLEAIDYQCLDMVSLKHEQNYVFEDGELNLFILDSEMNCDSAIFVRTEQGTFLNMNDCKIHDQLHRIVKQYGQVDVFAAQFSGASWHPTCYEMPIAEYEAVCKEKILNKFEMTAKAIETIKPAIYLPSAGPPCFLDPLLMPINFQPINTYPRAFELISYLNQRVKNDRSLTQWKEISPGDVLNVSTLKWEKHSKLMPPEEYPSYVTTYAKEKKALFQARDAANQRVDPHRVFVALKGALEEKVHALKEGYYKVNTLLYWQIEECLERMYCIDLTKKTIEEVSEIKNRQNYFKITSPAWQVNKVLTKDIRWSDFALTFRVRLERVPAVYNTILHGFLILDPEKIGSFCEKLAKYERNQERIIIEYEGKKYSVLRYCPHQGADLSLAHFEKSCLVCPRHHWKFDIENKGRCVFNETSIDAICLDHGGD